MKGESIMSRDNIYLTLTPQGKSLNLNIDPGISLRKVERALCSREVEITDVIRLNRQIVIPFNEIHKIRDALENWNLNIDDRVTSKTQLLQTKEIQRVSSQKIIEQISLEENVDKLLTDFPERAHLDKHQIQAVAAASHPEVLGLCIFDEQGLGKTVMTLFSFHRLRQNDLVNKMIVITPKNVVFEWIKDNEHFFGKQYKCIAVLGSLNEKREKLNTNADIYVTNFETSVSLNYRLRQLLESGGKNSLLVVDESFFVKNPGAKRTQAIKKLRASAGRCIVLCGTPAPNSPLDIVEQFNIADQDTAFRGIGFPDNVTEARREISQVIRDRGVYIRRLKQKVLPELPNKTFHRVLLKLQPEQETAYITALRGLINDLRAVDDIVFKKRITSFMAKRFALLQICTTPDSVIEPYNETPAKIVALDSILEELIGNRNEKVLVWSYFTNSIDKIYERYNRYNPVRLDGQVTNISERRGIIERFQNDEETMLFVANPAAAGAGITLHRARYAVYESLPVQSAHYYQSLDRIHRRGQDRDVEYLILLCERTIEENYYTTFEQKERSSRELLGDVDPNNITRSTLLAELEEAAELIGLEGVER